MSTTIDSRVVEMKFDNKQFEQNVATSMTTLEKLKQSLNLSGASKGLENVNQAARSINLAPLGQAAETVTAKFSYMQMSIQHQLNKIVDSAVSTGKRVVSALTIDPIKTGLQEYETQINAVQTILANTESKGSTLNDVNSALDALNEYADKTIYNFTEMTRNIGTFTAAGVDLDTSVNAIQGIANLAAISGSNSQQASTAMYQLSQALSSGTVKLMDWNSVVNAGMGGQVFQDALKETARVHGVNVDKMIEKNGSFRESLQEGWITSEILTETLSHFTMAAEEGSKEWTEYKKTLMDTGYSEEQANAILKMSNTATDAATKVKTATQLYDTLKETAQSGWTQTWEIIFGDFEEAKSLFSELYETLSPILEASSKARNDLLKGWKDIGGRSDLLDSMRNIFEGIGNLVAPIKDAFNEIFPRGSLEEQVSRLKSFSEGIKNFTESFKNAFKPGTDNAENLKKTFKGLFAVLDIVKQAFGAVFKAIAPLFGGLGNLGGDILGVTASWGDWLVALNESIKKTDFFTKVIEKIQGAFKEIKKFLEPVIDGFKNFKDIVSEAFSGLLVKAEGRLEPLAAFGNFIKNVFIGLGNILQKVFPYISKAASGIGNAISNLFKTLANAIQNTDYDKVFDVISGGIMSAIGIGIARFFNGGGGIIESTKGFVENLGSVLEGAGDALGAFTNSLKADVLKKIATAIAILAGSLLVLSLIDSSKLVGSLGAVTAMFIELMGAMSIFGKISGGKGIKDMLAMNTVASAMTTLAKAILVLSIALKIMSTMSVEEMGVALLSLTVGLGALIGAVNLLPEKKVSGSAKAIQKMSSAILVLAVAIKIMSTMSWSEMGVGLISMVVGLGAMVGAVNLLPKDTAMRAAGLVGLAFAMVILGAALKIMATMSWEDIAKSLVALAGSLTILAGAMALMKTALPGALAMMTVAPALVILAGALTLMSGMSWEEIARGLVALGGSLLIIAGAMALMKMALPGAAALLVVTASLALLTPVLMALGSMSLAEIGKSLLMLAGVFAVFGIAALVLAPLVPTMIALSASLALLGVACAAIGAGVLMCGVGLTMLAAALAVSGGAITTFVASIISLIPFLAEQIGLGIINICGVIAGGAAAICEAVTVIIVAVVDAVVASAPALVEGVLVLLTSLLGSLASHLPTIVTHLVGILVTLFGLLADHVPEMMGSIFEFIASIFEGLATNISTLVQPFVNLLTSVFQALADVLGPIIQIIIDVIDELLSGVSNILQAVADVITAAGEVIATIFEGIASTIDSVAGAIETSLNGLSEIFDSVFNGISNVITSVGDSIKSVLDGIAGVIDSIGEAALNAGTGFENLANGVKIITDLKLADMVASLAAVASGISDIAKHSDEMEDVSAAMDKLESGAQIAANAFKVVNDVIEKFVSTINSYQVVVKNVATNLVVSCANAISSNAGLFTYAGKYLGDGLIIGINAKKSSVYWAAYELGRKAVEGEKDGQQSHSPSKATIQAGKWLGEGLVIGMKKIGDKVYNAGSALGEQATNNISSTISQIANAISTDIDAQPTIRPVLDLSDVRSGANAISGLLGVGAPIGVQANVNAISSMMNSRGQNGTNSDVVSAIDKLRKDIGNINTNSYNINGINIPEGTDAADAIHTLVRVIKMKGRS